MKPFLMTTIAAVLIFPAVSNAEEASNFRMMTSDSHYYNDECCYCATVNSITQLPGKKLKIEAGGQSHVVPNSNWRGPPPEKPDLRGIIVCDPVEKEYFCLIAELGA